MGYPSPGPTIQIGDFFNDLTQTPVVPSTSPGVTLLASLQIYAEATNPTEVYTVQVANASFTNLLGSTSPSSTVSSTPPYSGTITVVAASAVPEPASMVSGMTALVVLAGISQVYRLRQSEREACLHSRPGAFQLHSGWRFG